MKSFYAMDRGGAAALLVLVLFSAASFHPLWRTTMAGGMAMFGWLMAALMVLSPVLALVLFLRERSQR